MILLVLTALFALWLAPHDPNGRMPPLVCRPGRTLARHRQLRPRPAVALLYGARPALGLVALVTAITLPVGLLVGILRLRRVAGADTMRFTDVVMSMPRLILAFAFVAMLGPGWSTARWR